MKQKYILAVYDKLINEIKYNKKTSDSEIIAYLKKCTNESYYLYKIKFSKLKGKIKYAHQKKVHNLHPNAPEFIKSDCIGNPEFINIIPLILKELNIPDCNLEFYWTEQNVVIIKQQCKIEEITKENRFFLYCFQTVYNGNSLIKESLNEKFFSLKKEEAIELFIHRKQYALQNLSNALIKVINPNIPQDIYTFSSEYTRIDCFKITFIYLEKLLVFIENEYHIYLNVNDKVPYRSILVKELEIENKLNFVKTCLSASNLNDDLYKITYLPLLKIGTIKIQEKITYNEFYYCIDYINGLYNHFQKNIYGVTESIIKDWLFEMNYNCPDFYDFHTNEITQNLERMDSDIDKNNLLYHLLKKLHQSRDINFRKFNQKTPPLKDQLINWVEEEIEYLSRKKRLDMNSSSNINNKITKVKIQTNMSVAHFSYFNKLLMQAKALSHNNNSEFFKFIADNYKTKLTENISADSVKAKYHNVEESTIIATQQLLIKLYNLAK